MADERVTINVTTQPETGGGGGRGGGGGFSIIGGAERARVHDQRIREALAADDARTGRTRARAKSDAQTASGQMGQSGPVGAARGASIGAGLAGVAGAASAGLAGGAVAPSAGTSGGRGGGGQVRPRFGARSASRATTARGVARAAAAGVGGTIGGLAGPLGALAGVVIADIAFSKLAGTVGNLGRVFENLTTSAAELNASVAVQRARSDIDIFFARRAQANQLAPQIVEQQRARTELTKIWIRLETKFAELLFPFLTRATEFITVGLNFFEVAAQLGPAFLDKLIEDLKAIPFFNTIAEFLETRMGELAFMWSFWLEWAQNRGADLDTGDLDELLKGFLNPNAFRQPQNAFVKNFLL